MEEGERTEVEIDARDVDDVEREVVAGMVQESEARVEEIKAARLAKLTERLDKAINANKTSLVRTLRREIEQEMETFEARPPAETNIEDTTISDVDAGHLNPFEKKRGRLVKVERARTEDTGDDLEWAEIEGGLRIPAEMFDRLFEYQKTSLRWLWELHGQCAGGLIGDEMGLGKTIQVIAFMTALALSQKFESGTGVLILAPATVLRQWQREFETWAGKYSCFRVRVLHASDEDAARSMKHEMAILRYVKQTLKSKKRPSRRDTDSNSDSESESLPGVPKVGVVITTYEHFRKYQEALSSCEWEYAVLDEGHKIRNPDAAITQACKRIETPRRLLLSGSPMQNSLRELWSLFDFVFPGKLGDLDTFETQFGVPISLGGYASASPSQVHTAYQCAVALKTLITPYMLRRMKKDVALQLPKKSEQILFCKLAKGKQTDLYKEFLDSRYVREVVSGAGNALSALGVLRKICNHPALRTGRPEDESQAVDDDENDEVVDLTSVENLIRDSGKMMVLDKVLHLWAKEGHRVLLFSQSVKMLSLLEEYMLQKGFSYRRMDGSTPTGQRMELIDEFNGNESVFAFLLTTRVGGLGVNLTGANRVVIYDPDWNPANDLQARERAWRVGQKKEVVVYRLVTSGTVEEKIYHRQVYKQFLGQKVLLDPKQRRFFKPKTMRELFRYVDDEDGQGTETGDIFTGTNADEIRTVQENNQKESRGDTETSAGDEDVLLSLLGKKNDPDGVGRLHSAIDHDKVLGSSKSGMDLKLIEYEAGQVAKSALEELKRSRERLDAERSGDVDGVWRRPKLSGVKRKSSSNLMTKMRMRETGSIQLAEPATDLAQRLSDFLAGRGGTASTNDLLGHFESDLSGGANAVAIFKALLKKVARLERPQGRTGPKVWHLLRDE